MSLTRTLTFKHTQIFDKERYPDCDRATQHKLADDIQAACREQGHCISVKEWADKNQHRGTLRLRLRCRSSQCRFQFQLNWDSRAEWWFISRRRCGTFVHTCQPVDASQKRRLGESARASPHKRVRRAQDLKETVTPETTSAAQDALDALLDLSKAPSSPSPVNEENHKPRSSAPVPSSAPSAASYLPVERYLMGIPPGLAAGSVPLSAKLVFLRNDALLGRNNNFSPAMALRQPYYPYPPALLRTDPRLLGAGYLSNYPRPAHSTTNL